jgi:hypothetical protein
MRRPTVPPRRPDASRTFPRITPPLPAPAAAHLAHRYRGPGHRGPGLARPSMRMGPGMRILKHSMTPLGVSSSANSAGTSRGSGRT